MFKTSATKTTNKALLELCTIIAGALINIAFFYALASGALAVPTASLIKTFFIKRN